MGAPSETCGEPRIAAELRPNCARARLHVTREAHAAQHSSTSAYSLTTAITWPTRSVSARGPPT